MAAAVDAAIPLDPERVCADFVRIGELKLAFSTILRHIGSIAVTKAERNDVTGKATKTYTESLIDRLTLITGHEIEEATNALQSALAARLAAFGGEFHRAREAVHSELDSWESDIRALDRELTYLKRLGALPFQAKEGPPAQATDAPQTDITPRRQALHRSLQKSHKRIVQFGRATAPAKNPEFGDTLTVFQMGK
jgi:hypothetical protein